MCPGGLDWDGCPMPDFCWPNDSYCPANCGKDEMECPGPYDYVTGKQMGENTCMPYKSGECANFCPVSCGKDEMLCAGGVDSYTGCMNPDFRHFGEFCPANCGKDEIECPGPYDYVTG